MVTPPPSTPATARGSRTPPASRKPSGVKQPQQRSTCDACQDAKIRCSHDKPRCRRCISQDLSCVYSVSRRMGRPRRLKSPGPSQTKSRQSRTRPESSQSSEHASGVGAASVVVVAERSDTQPAVMTGVSAQISPLQTSAAPGCWASSETVETGVNPFDGGLDWPDSLDLHASTTKVYNDGFLFSSCLSDFEYTLPIDFPDNPTTTTTTTTTTTASEVLSEADRVQSARTPKMVSTDSHLTPTTATVLISPDPHAHLEPFGINAQRPRGQINSTPIEPATTRLDFFEPGPTNDSCNCHCYESVMQGLTGLDDLQSERSSSSTTIDVVMSLETSVATHTARVLACEACLGSRPSLLLLLVVIIDHMVCMLETTTSLKNKSLNKRIAFRRTLFPSATASSSSSGGLASSSSSSSSLATAALRDDRSLAAAAAHRCALRVGAHEILGDARVDFLKRLVQTRLSRLSATLQQLRYHMQRNPQNSNSKAGTIMITDINRRLQLLIGRVELWVG